MLIPLLALIGIVASAFGFTAWKAKVIEAQFPNAGELIDVGGFRMNSLHIPGPSGADLPAIVFIHGASGNLRDQEIAFRKALEGRAEMLFIDRPGHGYSERGGPENDFPDGQAAAIARLMEKRGIQSAIIAGHSFGGAIAASFALFHPEKTTGLLLLAPATHPWPGSIDWYYNLTARPILGRLFSHLLALPAGLALMETATRSVFHPNPRPETYLNDGAPALVLRPRNFRHNAIDVANLNAYVTRISQRYREIVAPTVIITGDTDAIVAEEIHSRGLARDIKGSELVWIRHLGHKPDYVVTDVVVAAIEKLAGLPRDLQAAAHLAEARIAPRVQEAPVEMDLSIEKT
ncbi:pimeloyl-ACP methyl ester carboxylesterase [Neorhizobium sp. R1-B]|uniref:alpha/beta fold hydrolase n=1 Tax=Neorhizobium TaxID=1525371 RepID=UPI000CF962AD|nr:MULTISPECIES: alpha/beta hydrolase [Neorhizobium]TCV60824.1 pimeloyl-ACP methyl ester carboxylesterase [Neorhizobium sp. S3-V5DH]TDX73779.1 pimeloyl-ACP methyl ester carboxylesterase [Neorhizobium sp. R1-B]